MARMINRKAIIVLLISLGIVMGREVALGAETPAEFFRGKTLNWIVVASIGGGCDLNARAIAPFLEKEIGVKVRIENRDTDEGINYVYNQGTRDGLTLAMKTSESIIGNEIMKAPGVRYETKKLNFITDVFASGSMFQISPKLPNRTLDALRKAKGLRAGAASAKGSTAQGSAVMFEILGLDGKFISGFAGKKELSLALARGELDFVVISDSTAKRDEEDGYIINLFALGSRRNPVVPHVPSLSELGVKIPKEMENVYNYSIAGGQPLVLPPDVPEPRIEYLRKAFQRLSNNKELREAIKKLVGRSPDFVPGQELQQEMVKLASDKELGNKLNSLLKKYTATR